jgi:DNA (cytosine-5)-methyltransferase 1
MSSENQTTNSSTSLKYIDLFCGIGGFHQVLRGLGHTCVFASDKDKACRETYKDNYGLEPAGDITNVKTEDIPDFDILCGGFPCQPFSNAGKKKSLDDERGGMFDEIMRIVKEKKPRFMFLENVKNIMKIDNGEVIKYIKHKLEKHGYKLQLLQMSPHEYGIPQQRERIYFICVRNDIYDGDVKLKYEKVERANMDFRKYLDKPEDIDEKYFVSGDVLTCLEAWEEMIKEFEVNEKISPTIMANEFHKNYSEEEFKALATWRQDYITRNRPLYNKYKDKWDAWYEKNSKILNTREIYAKLEWQVGTIKENDSIYNYFIQMRQSGARVKKTQYFPTLVAISQIPIYGKEKRYLTPRECLRIQSFPESFKLHAIDRQSYKQAGNSINIENARNVIESTLEKYI